MTTLRQQMDNAMLVRGFADRTRESYLAAVSRLAKFYYIGVRPTNSPPRRSRRISCTCSARNSSPGARATRRCVPFGSSTIQP
jgi:hypothetical protein